MQQMTRLMSEGYTVEDDRIIERIRISTRDAIDTIQVLLLNQIDSSRFKNWLSHSWKACGYTSKDIKDRVSPTVFCFNFEVSRTECFLCDPTMHKCAFIRCGWCKIYFCEFHFFFHGEIHFCEKLA